MGLGFAHERFFVLRGSTLLYFTDSAEAMGLSQEPSGEVELQFDSQVRLQRDGRLVISFGEGGGAAEPDLVVQAESHAEIEVWKSKLEEKIDMLRVEAEAVRTPGDLFDGGGGSALAAEPRAEPPAEDAAVKHADPVRRPRPRGSDGSIDPDMPFDRLQIAPWIPFYLSRWIEEIRDQLDDDDEFLDDADDEPGADGAASAEDKGTTRSLPRKQSSRSGSTSSSERRRRKERQIVYNHDEAQAAGRLFTAETLSSSNPSSGRAAASRGSPSSRYTLKGLSSSSEGKLGASKRRPSLKAVAQAATVKGKLDRLRRFRKSADQLDKEEEEDEEKSKRIASKWLRLLARWVTIVSARSGDDILLRAQYSYFRERFPDTHGDILDGENLLRAAVRRNYIDAARFLIDEAGVDVNCVNAYGMTPITFSLLFLDGEQHTLASPHHGQGATKDAMIRFLLDRGADPTRSNMRGQTLLFSAARMASSMAIELTELLLNFTWVSEDGAVAHKLSLSTRDKFGSTVLHHAVLFGNMPLVQYLLDIADGYAELFTRANWVAVVDAYTEYRMSRDEHIAARNSWMARGLLPFARNLSPIGVAVLHNQGDIANYLMAVGTSRCLSCERRLSIFHRDNEDLRLIGSVWPALVPDILNSYIAESDATPQYGHTVTRIVLHPWYGCWDTPVQSTPLALALGLGVDKWNCLFQHRILQLVIQLKWRLFGRRLYYQALMRFSVLVSLYLVSFVLTPDGKAALAAVLALRWCCWAVALFVLVTEEGRELSMGPVDYFKSIYNWLSSISYLCILCIVPIMQAKVLQGDDTPDSDMLRLLRAVAGALLLLRTLEFLAIHKSTGRLVAILGHMAEDTARWLIIFVIFLFAFTLAFFAILHGDDNFESYEGAFFEVFRFSIGEADTPFSYDRFRNGVASLLYIFATLLIHLLYVNLLIATLSRRLDTVQDNVHAVAAYNRAQALLSWESILSKQERRDIYMKVRPPPGKRQHFTIRGVNGSVEDLFCERSFASLIEADNRYREVRSLRKKTSVEAQLERLEAQVQQLLRAQGVTVEE